MPITRVGLNSSFELQQIADTLAKSRKVVVLTGAGISTNCGIPDFRSEDGLYSLIQAQFDSAMKNSSPNELKTPRTEDRPRKKRRQWYYEVVAPDGIIPNSLKLKGRDLFDAMIWLDPFKTSIFYMFISSFRERIKSIKSTSETHHFLRQLRDSGRLVRTYTQNIDCLEEKEGLSTDLNLGPGNRARFSSRKKQSIPNENFSRGSDHFRGVETVLLHGSLSALRCGLCSQLCNWDEDGRSAIISIGSAPDCPHCIANSSKRKDTGRRALTVGRLRPDIVLYGEEHPNSSLISPLVTHDLKLCPDILLVMGTSLRVHGLKVIVKEFAKAVHSKGGKVVFVNKTGPPESIWANIIDYWVDWDCDEWVLDLKERKSDIWPSQRAANNDKLNKYTENFSQPDTNAQSPTETLEDRNNGAYFSSKILDCLARETLDMQNSTGIKYKRRSFNSYTNKYVAFTEQEKFLCLPKDAWSDTPKESLELFIRDSENGLKRKAQPDTYDCRKSIKLYLLNNWRKFFSEAIVADASFLRPPIVTVPPLFRQPVSDLLANYHYYIPSFLQQITASYGYSSIPMRNPTLLAREILRQYTPRTRKNSKLSTSRQGKLIKRKTIVSSDVENVFGFNKPNIISLDVCDSLIIHSISRNNIQNDDTNLAINN
ncbi:BgTH12-00203 [Blumeria graminis f. sp. triticale]|uniref:Bgt-402 n=3 Tax=Blumeria graminis TaxID=34373 RepID=A0A381LC56_BLUGR|nr:NAD(+)-dependent protein deacetylase [Blumeria graminis f. sp. tritici 96224]CAD6504697.1 BgTH12-00203 [Blumeria graminis f. sp. triticale]VDB92739.1 Bgt-402 [Blumeria graminis f. sp. tritici]